MDEDIKNYQYGIKSTLAQCMAISGVWFLQIELGAIVMVPTIVIGALENNASKDINEFLTMTSEEASWFASLLYLFTPLGNVLSSLLLDRLGHKKCMILTNIPCLVAHIMLYFAENIDILYASSILMALGMGFSNAPSLAYAGEVCEPKLRGALTSALNIFYYGGSITLTTLYSYNMQWRLTVLITTVFPILTIVILLTTPDSPMWLLARGKHSKAHRNLSRLRGKVSYDKCENEFQEMVKYNIPSNNDEQHHKENTNIWKQLLEPEVLRPLRLMTIYFFYMNLLSGLPLLPYLVAILNTFAAPVNVEWTISFSMFLSVIGSLMAVFLIRKLGKRILTLVTLSVCSICYILIGFIGVYWKNTESWTSWTVLILFLTTILVSSIGITPVSWTLVTEIFPAKELKNNPTSNNMEGINNYKYGIKSTIAQFWAISSIWLLQFQYGIQVAIFTIVIGALEKNVPDENEFLTITREEASWFDNLSNLFTLLGHVLSSLLLDHLGHKKCMILTNILYLIAQIMLYFAKNLEMLYASMNLMALGMGFSIAPSLAYAGETPDSPMWLLARGKHSKAHRNLSILRGKVSYDKCESEFQEMSFVIIPSVTGSLMAVFLICKLGKRVLTLFTSSVCSICYILIGLISVYWKNTESWTSWTVLILFLTTILVTSIGIIPVSWTLVTEIFPAKELKNNPTSNNMEGINNYKYGIKSTIAQFWAISSIWLLQFQYGIQVAIFTIVIGALEKNVPDENEFLTITREEASWFDNLSNLFTLLGHVLSSLLLDHLGHKKCMILTNILYLIAQIMLYFAKNLEMLYASMNLMALGMGFSIAPSLAYAGEIPDSPMWLLQKENIQKHIDTSEN
ncbi:hypothetical protein AGLY_012871 [Aphis glycines]|uniref:Major facilitator superfamily (MFS) profile domain-containing protein n=1 Tax=Aphis glycines TaxID=307491 RepID=A0A6G0TA29_APHGL|nr:hypothetical protein AGLY_012871 [Aphis glycines]